MFSLESPHRGDKIYHFQYKKENHLKLSQICSYGIFSKGLKDEFERAVVNEPSVFEPLKFYCTRFVFFFYQLTLKEKTCKMKVIE